MPDTKIIKKWDNFWQNAPPDILDDKLDDWYSLVWKVGREYWCEIFDKYGKGKKLIECGAGSAKLSLYLAKHGYDCTMLDNSEEGLNLGKARFSKENLPGKFILGDVTKMGFKDATFDIVTSGGLLHHFEDIRPAVKEMVRVLKPGGVFAAVVIPKKFSCQTVGDFEHFMVRFAKNLMKGRFKGIISESSSKFPFYISSLSLKQYMEIFQAAGLENVVGTGLSPFPSLALPQIGQRAYAELMKKMMPLWKRFDSSHSKFTEIWGASFGIYGFKK